MQNLDVISVNLWQILISLANLVLLFLIIKKFLYKPVKNVLAKRREEIDSQYNAAKAYEEEALQSRNEWERKLSSADSEADAIIRHAQETAKHRGDNILAEASEKADGIIRTAKNEADFERKKAYDDIKREIVEVSGALTEKILEREINKEDHRDLIDSFINKIGDDND